MQVRDLFEEPQSGEELPHLQALLDAPLDVFSDWQRAEHLLLAARAQLPQRLELTAALYKLYAYSNRNQEALTLIRAVLADAAREADLPRDYLRLEARHAQRTPARGAVRHYLYALKAMGYVLLRMGELDAAVSVLTKLRAIDPFDQVGWSVVLGMAERILAPAETSIN